MHYDLTPAAAPMQAVSGPENINLSNVINYYNQ